MKRTSSLVWLLIVFIISTCSAPAPSTKEVPPTATPITTPTQTAAPHSSPEPSQAATPFQPVPFSSSLDPNQVSVDVSISYQTIDGFGATHNSLIYQGMGSSLTPELRAQAVEAIYQKVGINLGNLEGALLESPGSYEQRSNDNDDPNEFNWSGFQTFGADAMQSNLLALAKPYGFNGYYVNQRVNIRWASPWLEELRNTDYPRYLEEAAEQVAAGNIYWRDQYGIVPRYIMLFNEPLSGNGELQSGNVQEVVDLVKAIGARLEREGFNDVRFVLPNEETVTKSLETAAAVLSDPVARKYVGPIGYHSYHYGSPYTSIPRLLSTSGAGTPDPDAVAARDKLRLLSQQYNLPVWMTEVSHGEVDSTSYDDFRGRAIHIHDELVYAHASAYFGMNNMWDTFSQEEHFGNQNLFDSEGTIVLIDNNQKKVYITGMGYAIGHYARWVKPGAVRVEALSGDPLLQVTAFKSPDSGQLILVLINNHPAPKDIQVEVEAATLLGSISGEQSTASQYWVPLQEFPISSPTGFNITLPPESVTTFALPLERN
jgi:O-glycosyl hydrolase